MDSNDEVRRRTREQLRSAFSEVAQERSNHDDAAIRGVKSFRFGIGMLVLAVFTAAIGQYPLAIDAIGRVMFLLFGFILAIVGAYFIDRSSRSAKVPPSASESGETPSATSVRRVK